jgi:dienelactone hydrolase
MSTLGEESPNKTPRNTHSVSPQCQREWQRDGFASNDPKRTFVSHPRFPTLVALRLLLLLALIASAALARAQSDYRILPPDFNADLTQQMMRAYLREQVHDALDQRLGQLESALASREQLAVYQQQRRKFLRWTLGTMPERTPLKARITGTIGDDGFAIEKVLFESQPGFHVTANLYRPLGQGPFPAILHPIGHAENGKAYGDYQRVNRLLAQNGFVVLCFDPIGQGERKQLFAPDGSPAHRASSEHQQLGVAPILLGRGLASYMVWDGVRAIDYLCSRPDVDPDRIGCTGNSGGGNLTSYLMAYDDRIAAAAPGCFLTTHRRKNETPGPGDAEQNLFAQIRDGFDHPDFVLTRAPKPTLILAATHDFVPIQGTWEAYRQAKRVYTQLGHPERIELIEADAEHGYSRRLREGSVRFFARWLQGRRLEVFEQEDIPIHSDRELQVTPNGQVRKLPNARSIFDLFTEYEQQLADRRGKLTREVVRRVTRVRQLDQLAEPVVEVNGVRLDRETSSAQLLPRRAESTPENLVFRPESGIVLPALHWPQGDAEPVLIAPDAGINSAVGEAQRLNAGGHPVLIVEVRDTGETKSRNWRFPGADYYIAHMLGRCWLAMRTEDLLVCARWLRDQHGSESVRLAAIGEIGPAALHAAALEPTRISSATVTSGLSSWRQLMTAENSHKHLHNAIRNALKYYDLPDLQRIESESLPE